MKKIFFLLALLVSFQVQAQIGYLYVQPPIVVQVAPQPPSIFQQFIRAREERAYMQQQQLQQQNLQLQNELLREQIARNNQGLAK